MVVNDFDIVSMAASPLENHSPLVVDSDGIETFPSSHESFQSVSGRRFQIFSNCGIMEI